MFPILTIDDADNRRCGDPELVSKHLMGVDTLGVQFPDVKDIGLCQLGPTMGFPTGCIDSPVSAPVKLVITQGVPTKVVQRIVGAGAVIVGGTHSGRAWTPEGKKDKNMDPDARYFPIPAKAHSGVTCAEGWMKHPRFVHQFAFRASNSIRPHASLVANLVSGPIGDRQPSLLNLIGDRVRFFGIHGGTLFHRVILWLEPGLLFMQRCLARFFIARPRVMVNG